MSEYMSDITITPERIECQSEHMSDTMPEMIPDRISEYMSDGMPAQVPEKNIRYKTSDRTPEKMCR